MAIRRSSWQRNLWDDVAFCFSGVAMAWICVGMFRLFFMDPRTGVLTIGGVDGAPFLPMQLILVFLMAVGAIVAFFGFARTIETLVRRYKDGDQRYLKLY